MIERRVEGVAILTFGRDHSLIEVFRKRKLPVFTIDADSDGQLFKTARVDYQHGIRQAVQHLAALGHVRIAFVSGPPHLKTAAMREHAFEHCMNEIGLETPRELFVEGDHTMEAGMRAMSALASSPNRPSAVVCSNDLAAIGVMRQAFELSLEVPRNLSVIGFDDIRFSQFVIPPLTTVQMSQVEIAETAFTALLESVEGRHPHELRRRLSLRRISCFAVPRRWRLIAG